VLGGRISEKTDNSRSRRAINCVNCEPKSRTTIVWCVTGGRMVRSVRLRSKIQAGGSSD